MDGMNPHHDPGPGPGRPSGRRFTVRLGGRLGAAGATNFLMPGQRPDGAGAPAVAATAEAILSIRPCELPNIPKGGPRSVTDPTVQPAALANVMVEKMRLLTSAAPGAAQTYTAQLRQNAGNVGTALALAGAGAANQDGVAIQNVRYTQNDLLAVSVTSSGGAAGASDALVELDCFEV